MRLPSLLAVLLVTGCSQAPRQTAPAPSPPSRLDLTEIDGKELVILDKEKRCVLQAGSAEFPLKPQPPCYFLRRGGKLQQFSYADVGVDWTIIVGGTPMAEPDRAKWNIDPTAVCGSQTQGVLSKGGKVEITEAVHSGGAYCKEMGVDEKDFYSFAHGR